MAAWWRCPTQSRLKLYAAPISSGTSRRTGSSTCRIGAGANELLGHLATYLSGWTGYHAEVMGFIGARGQNVVVILHETAHIGDSGVPIERDLVQV